MTKQCFSLGDTSQLLRAGKHGICQWCCCTSIRVAPQPLTQYPKPGGTSFINVLTPDWSPWRSAPSRSLPCSSKSQGQGTGSLSSSHPLSQQNFSISPCVGLLGVLGNVRKGRESCSEERSPEDQEEGVTIPSNTLLRKPLRKCCLLLSPSSLPTSQQILVT